MLCSLLYIYLLACSAHFLAGLAPLSPALHPALCARTHVINVISARGPARAEPCAALVTAAAQVNTRGTQVTNQRAAESQVTNQRPAFPAAAPVASPPVTRSDCLDNACSRAHVQWLPTVEVS